ncbi:TonB-dependent receptor plug domain-containing protein [Algoriphagus mannitolivorans]|uniref:TonB-dependent receptor plug domain-containing protein n=1 Tax=Algoriphagus mannitolivorans TaxID=226504 RepID=UPI00042798CD|nr:TonB-dependent receptor [Algoriphagus mannitolivorans]
MRALPLFYFFLLFSGFLQAQQVTVLEKESKKPLSNALIYVSEAGEVIFSNSKGLADLSKFEGEKKIHFRHFGFRTQILSWEELILLKFTVSMETDLLSLDAAVISANRWSQNQQDTPEKVRRLDQEKLILRNPANTADWLGSSGEVFIQKSQLGGGSPMIRGFSANRLLYSVDGVRMNTAIFRSGNLQNVISLDPFAVANTEVQFGPGSVMYGSDAIGGVMVFETLRPNPEAEGIAGNFISRFSSAYSEKTVHGDISYGSKKLKFLTSLSYLEFGDSKMGKNGGQDSYLRPDFVIRENEADVVKSNPNPLIQIGSGYTQLNLMQKALWKVSEKSTLDYGFHLSTSTDIPRYDRLIEKRNGQLRFARWDYGPQKWMMNNLRWTYRASHPWFDQVKVIFAQQIFEESRIDRRLNANTEFDRTEKVHAYSLNADFFKSLSEEAYISYGIEGVTNRVNSSGIQRNVLTEIESQASARYPNASWNSAAIYGSYHNQLSEKWKFQSAIRYNFTELTADFSNNAAFFRLPFSESKENHHSLTGNLGLIFTPEPSLSISPLISTGFRAPNVDDIGKIFDSAPGAVIVPNPQLVPEYAYNAEININKHFENKLKLDLTGYYTYLDKAMVRRPFTLDGKSEVLYEGELSEVLALQNAAFANVSGIQAGIEFALSKNLIFTSRYNWQKGKEELENGSQSPSRHAPPSFGLSRISYSSSKLRVEFTSQYSGERSFKEMPEEEKAKTFIYATDANGNPYSPSWIIFNLTANYQVLSFLQVNFGIENLTDQQYRPYSSGIVAPGRNFSLSLKASF